MTNTLIMFTFLKQCLEVLQEKNYKQGDFQCPPLVSSEQVAVFCKTNNIPHTVINSEYVCIGVCQQSLDRWEQIR